MGSEMCIRDRPAMVPNEVRAPVSMGGKRRYRAARACGSVQEVGVVAGCTGGQVSGDGKARTGGAEE